MRDYDYAMNILNSSALTVREKVGLLKTDCFSRLKGEMEEDVMKLRTNFRFFAGPHPVIERLQGGFDRETRVFWFTFDKTDYYEFGGRSAIQDFIKGFAARGGSCVAIPNTPDWWGVFPMPRQEPKKAPQSHEEVEVVPENEIINEEPQKKPFVPKVIRRRTS